MSVERLEKGSIIEVHGMWYVVVKDDFSRDMYCICDHANNAFYWDKDDIISYLTLKEIGNLSWEKPERPYLLNREIPYEIIVEVLSGRHDDRFNYCGGVIKI